jgi:phosphoribosylanthranilate isomerase
VKELGGTGRAHDWSISRRIREALDKPVFLAGGLRPENIAEAINTVQPLGLTSAADVRTNGRLGEQEFRALFAQAAAVA